ncbi:hypothetical protein TorRG33x02_070380 [Trema orientale]|uniref:Uncharacterized protein n=1 Tax=Trema orientale TaxID=63057 RepID=A0A2P5FHN5_TREOI|nr:hypothetical protein TorRG33x02_070380 [Trema orientale]
MLLKLLDHSHNLFHGQLSGFDGLRSSIPDDVGDDWREVHYWGEAKIGDGSFEVLIEEDVGGLDVAMARFGSVVEVDMGDSFSKFERNLYS